MALFLGSTHADDEDEFTVGLDYEYLFHEMLGVGCLIDHAEGKLGTSYQAKHQKVGDVIDAKSSDYDFTEYRFSE